MTRWTPLLALLALTSASGEKPLTEENSWAFAQPEDPFSDEARLDLRSLNEANSGESGFVRKSEDGNDFILGSGEPVRFWAVGTDAWKFSAAEMETHCRWLAKLGVNLVRLHVTVCDPSEGAAITDVKQEVIDGCHRLIAAAKKAGIYVLISPYYAHFDAPESWGLEGGKQPATGVIYIDEAVQEAYRGWTRQFYTSVNPHTGLAIKDDPTVAVLQVLNEDSLFFWTQAKIADAQKRTLGRHFGDWVSAKYGSVADGLVAWGDARAHEHDSVEEGIAGVHDIYFLTQEWKGGMAQRIRDQTEFMANFQRDFYAGMGRFFREELGCKQLLNATNWRTANDPKLKFLERYSYHALDIDAENEYVGSDYQHDGPDDHYRINPGHYLVNESVLSKPFEMCTNWVQEDGHPFIVTETAWKNPNRYQSEGPFLAAAYQSLNGVDAICWFSCQTPRYEEDPLKPFWKMGDQMATHKWNHCYPAMMAGFPANALLFRKGYLTRAEVAVRMQRSSESLWERETPPIIDNEAYGDQRNPPELQPGWSAEGDSVNRVGFQIGPVVSEIGTEKTVTEVADIASHFDPGAGVIRSSTDELIWRYRDEIATMDAPKAQGVTGFLSRNGGRFELTDVTIESSCDYATVNVVPLDDRPIAESVTILIQCVTVNRLTGFQTQPATFSVGKGDGAYEVEGEQIERIGTPPFRIANTNLRLTTANPAITRATVLDINGYPTEMIEMKDGAFTFPENTIYAVLE